MSEEITTQTQFGILEETMQSSPIAPSAPATPAEETMDPALEEYRTQIANRGETGRLFGQIKEITVAGRAVILAHPGLKTAMNIMASSAEGVPLIFDAPYAAKIFKEVVRYPREISQQGLDYFDEHPEQLAEVLSQAESFLGKFINAN